MSRLKATITFEYEPKLVWYDGITDIDEIIKIDKQFSKDDFDSFLDLGDGSIKVDIREAHDTLVSRLLKHVNVIHNMVEWSEIIGIKILDPDGWRKRRINLDALITLGIFLQLAKESTIETS